jgi:hypothetical protein
MDLENIMGEFLKQGFLGVLLIVAIYAIYRLAQRYDALQEKRNTENLENYKLIAGLTEVIEKWTSREQSREH